MTEAEELVAVLAGREALWPRIQDSILDFWALTRRPINEALEADGTPSSLYRYADFGLETLSLAEIGQRDAYSNPANFKGELEQLAANRWIEAIGNGQYRVTGHTRASVAQAIRAGDAYLEALDVLPRQELERHASLLARLAEASLTMPEPPRQWAIRRRFRLREADTPPLGLVRERAMDLYAYRDDSHSAAWFPLALAGYEWNAFTLIWHGDARNAVEVAASQRFRGYDIADYERAIERLVARGWIEADVTPGRYRATEAGQLVRDEVETRTDRYFYRPWDVLDGEEWRELGERQRALHERLSSVRSAQRAAARA